MREPFKGVINVDIRDSKLENKEERARLAQVFERFPYALLRPHEPH